MSEKRFSSRSSFYNAISCVGRCGQNIRAAGPPPPHPHPQIWEQQPPPPNIRVTAPTPKFGCVIIDTDLDAILKWWNNAILKLCSAPLFPKMEPKMPPPEKYMSTPLNAIAVSCRENSISDRKLYPPTLIREYHQRTCCHVTDWVRYTHGPIPCDVILPRTSPSLILILLAVFCRT